MHGGKPKYYHHYVGGNFRMDTLQCALLSVKVKRYAQYTADRQRNAAHYIAELLKLPGVVQADPAHCKCVSTQDTWLAAQNAKIVLPVSYAHNEHIWNQFTLRVLDGKRDSLRDHLQAKKIGCDIYYPVTLDQQQCFANPWGRLRCVEGQAQVGTESRLESMRAEGAPSNSSRMEESTAPCEIAACGG